MSGASLWLWEAYFLLAMVHAGLKVYYFVSPGSSEHLYYAMLRAFDPGLFMAYNAHVFYILLNALHCIPLLLFIHRIRFLNANFWKFLFVLRCLFEVAGQNYQVNAVKALLHANSEMLILFIAIMTVPLIPSYVACYLYAFRQDKVFLP